MSGHRGVALKRSCQMDVDTQRIVADEFISGKRQKLCSESIHSTGSNLVDSVSCVPRALPAKCGVPLSPLPRSNNGTKAPVPKLRSVGPYRLLAPLEENSKAFTAVDTRRTGRLVICRRLDRSQYERMMQLSHRLSSGLDGVDFEQQEENRLAYEQIFPASSELIAGDDGSFYYFEPKDCGSLHAYVVERKRLNEEECSQYFRQILRLLVFCHGRNVILRDLKLRKFVFADPDHLTIRLDGLDELCVCPDTNGEEPCDQNDQISDRHGCPAYVGPEILDLSQKSYSGRAADVWSLGVLLYVVLYGRYPFYDTTPARLFAKIRHAQIHLPDDAGVGFEARSLIRCLLRRDPTERPSALDILAHPWLQSRDQFKNYPRRLCVSNVATAAGFRLALTSKDSENDQCVPCVELSEKPSPMSADSTGARKVSNSVEFDEPAVPL